MVFQLEMGNTFLEPVRSGFSFEVMVEELPHSDGVVSLVFRLSQPVILAFVLEHDHRFSEASECVEVLDSLVPVHSTVFIVVEDNHRRFHVFCIVDRRVPSIGLNVIPITAFKPSLTAFKNRLVGRTCVPVN